MPRKRMLRPTIWDDPDLAKVTPTERLLFIGLISLADDYGHISANPTHLRKWVFGYDDFTVAQVREMRDHLLAVCRNLHLFTVDGQEYLWLSAWERHQDLRWRSEGEYPCHACGRRHKTTAEWATCRETAINPAYLAQDYASPAQDVAQELAPDYVTLRRDTLRRDRHPTGGAERAAPASTDPTPIKAKPPSAQESMFATIAEQCGYTMGKLTVNERGRIASAAKQLLAAHYDPVDVATMASNWVGHMDDCTMTPTALASNASRLMKPAEDRRNGRREADPDPAKSKYAAYSDTTV